MCNLWGSQVREWAGFRRVGTVHRSVGSDIVARLNSAPIQNVGSLVGQTVDGKFRIVDTLGTGAMGAVYLAHHIFMNREIALKVMNDDLRHDSKMAERFRREAEAASRIQCPHIVQMFDFGRDREGNWYMAMERLHGETLGERIARDPLPLGVVVQIGIEITTALHAAHRAGVVHRDLKPDNIMLCEPGGVKVLDFGIAKMIADEEIKNPKLTDVGSLIGTPFYMSPEAARGARIGPATDLYALGAILFEMVTGVPPYTGTDSMTVLSKHLTNPVPSVRDHGDVPEALDQLITRLLAKRVSDRPENAKQVQESLSEVANEIATVSSRWAVRKARALEDEDVDTIPDPISPARTTWRSSAGRRPLLAWVGAAVILMIAATVAWFVVSDEEPVIVVQTPVKVPEPPPREERGDERVQAEPGVVTPTGDEREAPGTEAVDPEDSPVQMRAAKQASRSPRMVRMAAMRSTPSTQVSRQTGSAMTTSMTARMTATTTATMTTTMTTMMAQTPMSGRSSMANIGDVMPWR